MACSVTIGADGTAPDSSASCWRINSICCEISCDNWASPALLPCIGMYTGISCAQRGLRYGDCVFDWRGHNGRCRYRCRRCLGRQAFAQEGRERVEAAVAFHQLAEAEVDLEVLLDLRGGPGQREGVQAQLSPKGACPSACAMSRPEMSSNRLRRRASTFEAGG